jgi:hypothetical protein
MESEAKRCAKASLPAREIEEAAAWIPAAQGLALPIGYLHSDKKGRNSLVWDAIE